MADSAVIIEMFSSVHETRLARGFEVSGMCLYVQDLGFDVRDGVGGLDIDSDGPATQGLGVHLHSSAKTEHQVKSALLLDVVVGESAAILELLSSED